MYDRGTATAEILTYYAPTKKLEYLHTPPYSSPSKGSTWSGLQNFTAIISAEHIFAGIDRVNEMYDIHMSTNSSWYGIELVTVQGEIYWPKGTNGHLGWSSGGVRLETV